MPKIALNNPLFYELFVGVFQFLDGNEVQKLQLVCRSWDSFITKNVRKLPLLLVSYLKLIRGENIFLTKIQELNFKLETLPDTQNYIIEHFKIFNNSFETSIKNDKVTRNIVDGQKQTLSLLSNHHIKVWNLKAEYGPDLWNYIYVGRDEEGIALPAFLNRLNEILNIFIVTHLNLILNIDYNYSILSSECFNIIENLQRYKEITITLNISRIMETSLHRRLIEWLSNSKLAKEGIKKRMIFENIIDDFLFHDDDYDFNVEYRCFMQVYVELFLAIQNPNKMFKNILIRSSYVHILRQFLNQNNIVSQKYRIEEDEDGYKMLFETDDFGTDITKELFEIKRDDGYILRILSDTEPIDNDFSKLLMFTIHHKDCPPEEFVPNWPAFPMARDQLGFDYVDMYGNLLEC